MSKTKLLVVVGVLVAALMPVPTSAGDHVIKATKSRTWNPEFKHVEPGTRIVWKNPTARVHTVTAYGGGWSKDATLAKNGGKTAKTFKNEGTFKYRCIKHSTVTAGDCSGMCGVVHVAN
ncbi:MAG: hypothetical protein ACLGHL_01140 [Actinomycetota bacterium]